MLTTATIPTTI